MIGPISNSIALAAEIVGLGEREVRVGRSAGAVKARSIVIMIARERRRPAEVIARVFGCSVWNVGYADRQGRLRLQRGDDQEVLDLVYKLRAAWPAREEEDCYGEVG